MLYLFYCMTKTIEFIIEPLYIDKECGFCGNRDDPEWDEEVKRYLCEKCSSIKELVKNKLKDGDKKLE